MYFQVYNTMHGETVERIVMDEKLIEPEAGIVDPESLTLRNIKNGGAYTIVPMQDPRVSVLQAVKRAYHAATKEPAELFSTTVSRMDAVLATVKLLFEPVEFALVECIEDMDKIINPSRERELKKVSVCVLDKMLSELVAGSEQGTGSLDALHEVGDGTAV